MKKTFFVFLFLVFVMVLSLKAQTKTLIASQLAVGCEPDTGYCWTTSVHLEHSVKVPMGVFFDWFTPDGEDFRLYQDRLGGSGITPAHEAWTTIPSSGRVVFDLTLEESQLQTGWLLFKINGPVPSITVQYQRTVNGDVFEDVAVTVAPPADEWRVPARTSLSQDLGLALVNPGLEEIEIFIELARHDFDHGGEMTSITSVTLSPGKQISLFLHELFPELPDSNGKGGRDNTGGLHLFSADGAFSVTAVQGRFSELILGGFGMSWRPAVIVEDTLPSSP